MSKNKLAGIIVGCLIVIAVVVVIAIVGSRGSTPTSPSSTTPIQDPIKLTDPNGITLTFHHMTDILEATFGITNPSQESFNISYSLELSPEVDDGGPFLVIEECEIALHPVSGEYPQYIGYAPGTEVIMPANGWHILRVWVSFRGDEPITGHVKLSYKISPA
jgi:hypothetical protein